MTFGNVTCSRDGDVELQSASLLAQQPLKSGSKLRHCASCLRILWSKIYIHQSGLFQSFQLSRCKSFSSSVFRLGTLRSFGRDFPGRLCFVLSHAQWEETADIAVESIGYLSFLACYRHIVVWHIHTRINNVAGEMERTYEDFR